jgi:UDP-glucose 4-epimerase
MHVIGQEAAANAKHRVAIFNLGTDEYCTVRDSIGWICQALGLSPELQFTGGNRGWIGDNPFIYLDTSKVRKQGWLPAMTIQQSVEATVAWLGANQSIFQTTAVSV